MQDDPELPFEVRKSDEEEGVYIVEGPRIEKMLGYTNLESEKGFDFFQKFLRDNGILTQESHHSHLNLQHRLLRHLKLESLSRSQF